MDRFKEAELHYDQKAFYDLHNEIFQSLTLKDKVLVKSHEYFVKCVTEILNEKTSGNILDFGCGTGNKTRQFANEHWKITGIDISTNSIEAAKKF